MCYFSVALNFVSSVFTHTNIYTTEDFELAAQFMIVFRLDAS